jgi:hypothetical protein
MGISKRTWFISLSVILALFAALFAFGLLSARNLNPISARLDVALTGAVAVLILFSPPCFLFWAWASWITQDQIKVLPHWRSVLGLASLIAVTVQLAGSLFALMVINGSHTFPANLIAWRGYTRIAIACSAPLVALSIAGHPRVRIPVICCAITTGLACLVVAAMD